MSADQRYYWLVTWYPDDEKNSVTCANYQGTYADAHQFAARDHPGFLCRLIEFCRMGEV